MIDRGTVAMLSVCLTATAMVWAPAAQATSRQTCQDSGIATICQTNGSVSIAVNPGTASAPDGRPQIPWPNAMQGYWETCPLCGN